MRIKKIFHDLFKFFVSSLLALLCQVVSAQQCPINLQLSYPDGSKGCLTELPISKRLVKSWGKSAEEVVKYANRYSLAASASCSEVSVASSPSPLPSQFQPQLDSRALAGCESKCECATIIRNGQVLISKEVALALGNDSIAQVAKIQLEEQDKKLKQQEKDQQLALQQLQEQKQQDSERVRERERLKLETALREQELLAQAQRLKAQQKVDEEARLLEQIKRDRALREREEALQAQESRFREQQRLAEESRLKQEELRLQALKKEEESRKSSASDPGIKADRELLIQLASELAKLRQQQAEQEKKLVQAGSSTPQDVVSLTPMVANRKALVIGNDRYKFVSPLNTAKEDAKSMADSLKSAGYQVSLKLDVSEKEFKATLRQFRNQVEAGDEVAFFYAGHGVQLNNNNFLVPIDVAGESEDQLRDEAIPLQRFLDDMNDKRVKFSFAMIDACRDNPFKGNGRNLGGGTRGLAPTTAATGQMVVFSAGAGQQALDKLGPNDKDKNGVFTRIFVREMQKPGVTVDRIVRNVRSEVVNLAKSVGHDQVPAIYDQTIGEFYFRSK